MHHRLPQITPTDGNLKATAAVEPSAATLVHVNGLAPGWRDGSQGCLKCQANDTDTVGSCVAWPTQPRMHPRCMDVLAVCCAHMACMRFMQVARTCMHTMQQPGALTLLCQCQLQPRCPQARSPGGASFSAKVAPWGSLVFASSTPFSSQLQLDLWARGSGLMACAILFEDSVARRYSRWARGRGRLRAHFPHDHAFMNA